MDKNESGKISDNPLIAPAEAALEGCRFSPPDADTELIVSLLDDWGQRSDLGEAFLAVQVRFGPTTEEMLISQQDEKHDTGLLACGLKGKDGPTDGGGQNATASTELSACVESGSMPTEALPIKIIFEDDGSASESLI